jgi:hypothetical protein
MSKKRGEGGCGDLLAVPRDPDIRQGQARDFSAHFSSPPMVDSGPNLPSLNSSQDRSGEPLPERVVR